MDPTTLTNNELADLQGAVIREIEARIEAHANPTLRFLARERAVRAHGQLDRLKTILASDGVIAPMSGGDKTP